MENYSNSTFNQTSIRLGDKRKRMSYVQTYYMYMSINNFFHFHLLRICDAEQNLLYRFNVNAIAIANVKFKYLKYCA